MPSKILNTNMGLGFQRNRKYDTDLDRLGRIETAQGELRKTRELNLQGELRKLKKTMNTYSVRRFSTYPYRVVMTEDELRIFSEILQREFGMGDVAGGVVNGVRDVAGNVVEGAGKLVDSPLGKAGGIYYGAKLGAGIGSMFGPLGTAIGGIAGAISGPGMASAVGKTVKGIGQDIHT